MVPLKVRYPQGGEKQLIAAVTGRQVPPPPALPIDVGAVVCNASTTYAVYRAVQKHINNRIGIIGCACHAEHGQIFFKNIAHFNGAVQRRKSAENRRLQIVHRRFDKRVCRRLHHPDDPGRGDV
ncbi:hypothetical protein [uncultured Allobaculum sp.]|uniref:hypothetical protein n=1 Tax=uncultured Allobaculum sp. TaxID=1187017 RepID=UPI00338F7F69